MCILKESNRVNHQVGFGEDDQKLNIRKRTDKKIYINYTYHNR